MVKKSYLLVMVFVFVFLVSGCTTIYTDGCCSNQRPVQYAKKEVVRAEAKKETLRAETKKEVVRAEAKKETLRAEAKKEVKKKAKGEIKAVKIEVEKSAKEDTKNELKEGVNKGCDLIKKADRWIKANLW